MERQQHNSAEIYGRAIVYGILQPPVYGKARVSGYFGVWIQRKQAKKKKEKNETSSVEELTMRTMEYYPSHT